MVRSSEQTRQQILDAAIEEFSTHGIAGARVDRIAKAAGANISSLFRYYGSKAQLFEAAFDALALGSIDVVPFDADDLPGYTGQLMDHYRAHPEIVRLSAWYQLERPAEGVPAQVVVSERSKLEQIERAQAAGTITRELSAVDLLNVVLHVSLAATGTTPILAATPIDHATARQAAMTAVERLVEPSDR